MPSLQVLTIHRTGDQPQPERWPDIAMLTRTRRLRLPRCAWITDLTPLLALTELREVDLSWCRNLTEEGLQCLAQLPHLERLVLTGTDVALGALGDREGLTIER